MRYHAGLRDSANLKLLPYVTVKKVNGTSRQSIVGAVPEVSGWRPPALSMSWT